jgi:hypothetical protein
MPKFMEPVVGEFGITGYSGPANERRELTDEERAAKVRANKKASSEVLARRGWTPDDLTNAKRCGFPAAAGRFLSGPYNGESYYLLSAIDAWEAGIVEVVARITKAK